MSRIIPMVNKRFGRALVLKYAGKNKWRQLLWKCRCDCGNTFITIGVELRRGRVKSCGCYNRDISSVFNSGYGNPNYKGGVKKRNIPLYDTYASQILCAEKIRHNKKDYNILEVKCAYCGKWFVPTILNVQNRIKALNSSDGRENRFYCSDGCKLICPIYRKIKYSGDFIKSISREVQPELRQMVFERDEYLCQRCGVGEELHCHHITGIVQNPIESADVDNCVTLCKNCHEYIHSQRGCTKYDYRCHNSVKGGI